MSEYMEKHTVSRLIGSPPGYVGYEEGGQLTEAVRRKPFSVVLFDEIEKAHPDVFNTLLQILEDGHLTDSQGHKVDFKNTIIIMTSNLGTRDIQKGPGIGFAASANEEVTYEKMRDRVTEELKKSFRPEFINRIDEVIVFRSLTQDDVKNIVDLMMRRVRDQLKAKDVEIELTEAAKVLLATQGYDQSLGARPLRRTIQRLVEDPLAEKLLYKEFRAGETIFVDAVDGEIVFEHTDGMLPPDVPPVELAGLDRVGRSPASRRRPVRRHHSRPKPGPAWGPGFSASRGGAARTGRSSARGRMPTCEGWTLPFPASGGPRGSTSGARWDTSQPCGVPPWWFAVGSCRCARAVTWTPFRSVRS